MAAVCTKRACPAPFGRYVKDSSRISSPIETPFVSWNHIIRQGYWCLPCCILDNVHSKMQTCSKLATREHICEWHNTHGRCGVDFNP